MAKRGGGAKKGIAGRSPTRQTAIRVKTAKRRTPASTQWLARPLHDPHVGEGKRPGYPSRPPFNLLQLDRRFHPPRAGGPVVEIVCRPGGWTQGAAEPRKPDDGQP